MKRLLPLLYCLLFVATAIALFGDTSMEVDWNRREIRLMISEEVASFTPLARGELQRRIESEMAERFLAAASGLQLNSSTRLEEWIRTNPDRLPELFDRLQEIRTQGSSYSAEFKSLSLRYRIPLFPNLAEVFIDHRRGYTLAPTLFHVPSAAFTGILIYAQEELPVHGENRESTIVPALFPRIWDDSMQLLFEPRMMDRETILTEGCVAYADSFSSDSIRNRVGPNPLRIAARGLFGITPTDPIISRADALALLNAPGGRDLLSQGRIAIIYPEQEVE